MSENCEKWKFPEHDVTSSNVKNHKIIKTLSILIIKTVWLQQLKYWFPHIFQEKTKKQLLGPKTGSLLFLEMAGWLDNRRKISETWLAAKCLFLCKEFLMILFTV